MSTRRAPPADDPRPPLSCETANRGTRRGRLVTIGVSPTVAPPSEREACPGLPVSPSPLGSAPTRRPASPRGLSADVRGGRPPPHRGMRKKDNSPPVPTGRTTGGRAQLLASCWLGHAGGRAAFSQGGSNHRAPPGGSDCCSQSWHKRQRSPQLACGIASISSDRCHAPGRSCKRCGGTI